MDKKQLEIQLQEAFNNGFWPKGITRFRGSSPLRIVDKEGEDERITVACRTTEENGRQHNHQYLYSLEEVKALLKEYQS